MAKEKLERLVTFSPAFDKRDEKNPKKNYGICDVRCFMVLKGKKGAVSFCFGTGMYLPKLYTQRVFSTSKLPRYMAYSVDYHAHKKQWKGQEISQTKCDWLDGKPCYADGSCLRADGFITALIEKGSKAVWKMLEADYKSIK
jgi:hypothetical protein